MFWVPCTDHWETDASKNETWRVILLTVHVQHPVPKYEHIKQTKSSTTENVVDIFFCNDSFVSRTCVCLVSRDPRIIAKIAVFWLPDFFKKIRDSKNTIFEVSKYWKICDFHTKKSMPSDATKSTLTWQNVFSYQCALVCLNSEI